LLPLYWLRFVTVLDLHVVNFHQCTHGFLTFNVGLSNSTTTANVNFLTTATRPRKFTLRPLTELTLQKFPKRQNSVNRFKQINQPDATISQVYYLMFMYSSSCFERPHAHHQKLNNCSSSLWVYRWSVVVAVLLVVVGTVK
jgi:hypothetical protein